MMGPLWLGALVLMQTPPPATTGKQESVAVLKIVAGKGVDPSVTDLLGQALVARVKAHKRFESTVGFNEIETLLSFERQKQLLQCEASSCMAEIAGALGVQYIISSSVGRLGSVWLFNAQLIDTRAGKLEASVSEKIKGTDESALVDALDRIVPQLLGGVVPPAPVATPPPPATGKTPPVVPTPPAPPPAHGKPKSWDDLGVDDIKRPKKEEREVPVLAPAIPPPVVTSPPPPPVKAQPPPEPRKETTAKPGVTTEPPASKAAAVEPPAKEKPATRPPGKGPSRPSLSRPTILTAVAAAVLAGSGLVFVPLALIVSFVGGLFLGAAVGDNTGTVGAVSWLACSACSCLGGVGLLAAAVASGGGSAALFLKDRLAPAPKELDAE